nr:MAG: replication associated protein [Cressdnaviricota sp.]
MTEETTHPTQGGTPARNTKSRAWCFTWNNYSALDIDYVKETLTGTLAQYLFGEEKGEQGTPHLQGVVRFKNARSFDSIKKLFKNNHVESCRNWPASLNYCSKEGRTFTNIEKKKPMEDRWDEHMHGIYDDVKWKPWQQDIIDIIETEPNRRTVNWVYDIEGNTGKSFLVMYIDWVYKCIIANGKTSDIFNCVKTWQDENKDFPQVIVCDVPRENLEYINYGTLEKLKDGLFYSGKYEGGRIRLLPLHLFVFANQKPKQSKLSLDRWNIINLCEDNSDSD